MSLERGFAEWELVTGLSVGESFGAEFPVNSSWKGTVPVRAGRALRFSLKPGERDLVEIRLGRDARLEAPIRRGQVLGRVEAWLGDRLIATVPALAGRDVDRSWLHLPFGREEIAWPVMSLGTEGGG